jgi:hypothetical protein
MVGFAPLSVPSIVTYQVMSMPTTTLFLGICSSCQKLCTHFFQSHIYFYLHPQTSGSVARIATGNGVDGLGIESQWGRDFPHLSRPALRPTQPPVQWVLGLFWGKVRPGRDSDPSLPSSAVDHERVELYLYSPYGPTACTEPQCLYKSAF